MKDLTTGSIPRHLVRLAAPIAAGMIFQTLYILVDLYFVAKLGDAAIAGVSAAGNVQFIIMALTQVLGVGTMALVAQAVGRKDLGDATLVFNQSTSLALASAAITLVFGYSLAGLYLGTVSADPATREAGLKYLYFYLPGLALQFALVSMSSALRGSGVVKPGMIVQIVSVIINAVLAPVLIAGWGTGRPMGVAGAGLASSIAIAVGVLLLMRFFHAESRVRIDPSQLRVRAAVWGRILRIGLPSGGEFALMFLLIGVIYFIIRGFGASAQAGYGVGTRVMQAVFLPAMAVAFATGPLAGQNFGAGRIDRVRGTFRSAALMGSIMMLLPTLLCQWRPEWLIRIFSSEADVVAIGADYLRMISWNFVASGLIFTCSGMFQALGNTIPSLISSASRLVTFALPALWLSTRPGFTLHEVWILSVLTTAAQAVLSMLLLRVQFGKLVPALSSVPPAQSELASLG
jgi:putative MATE family efflux protein